MNALSVAVVVAVVAMCGGAVVPSVLTPHVALPHVAKDNVGVHQVPVAPLGHYGAGVFVNHRGSPFLPSALPASYDHSHAALLPGSLGVSNAALVPSSLGVSHASLVPGSLGVSHASLVPGSLGVSHTVLANDAVAHGVPAVHATSVAHPVVKAVVPPAHVSHSFNHVAAPIAPVAPAVPQVAAIPTGAVNSQYHAQDELGQYSFGYQNPESSRQESRDAYGNVRGHYSYVDSNGHVQTQHYVADDFGFRVAGTDLPTAHY